MEFTVARNRGMYEVKFGSFTREVYRDEAIAKAYAASLNRTLKEKLK
jgi:hypothetical protein